MGEDSFFNALFHIMWNMETDIFSEKEKTLALLSDLVPKCKKQRKRIEAMYDCGAMDFIEKAVAERDEYEQNLKKAVRLLIKELNLSSEKALFAVNEIIGLWGGDLEKLEDFDENEDEDEDDDEIEFEDENENEIEFETEEDGEEDMIFLQDTAADEETTEAEETQEAEAPAEEGGGEEEAAQEPKESIVKKIVRFWCKGDYEDGRPYMFACPIGWVLILLCGALGGYMIYDIPIGDKFVAPTFGFMFAALTSKRLYRYESTGRFSIMIALFYLIAMGRLLWIGKGELSLACIPVVIAALIVFNSGRIGSWLDESKKKSFAAYTIIIVFSAAVTAGVYAIQHMEF